MRGNIESRYCTLLLASFFCIALPLPRPVLCRSAAALLILLIARPFLHRLAIALLLLHSTRPYLHRLATALLLLHLATSPCLYCLAIALLLLHSTRSYLHRLAPALLLLLHSATSSVLNRLVVALCMPCDRHKLYYLATALLLLLMAARPYLLYIAAPSLHSVMRLALSSIGASPPLLHCYSSYNGLACLASSSITSLRHFSVLSVSVLIVCTITVITASGYCIFSFYLVRRSRW